MSIAINEQVNVNAFYFGGRDMKTFPRRMEYRGQAVTFADGLRLLVQRGNDLIQLFDMSAQDGSTYRLRREGDSWTLVGREVHA
ncbi:MAG TPA: hypothetical protein VFH39_01045 [Candidatus Saccharimonadales bacterium]|nr:hypothetical protein [Candidatus Saccharimonadales bacterium]